MGGGRREGTYGPVYRALGYKPKLRSHTKVPGKKVKRYTLDKSDLPEGGCVCGSASRLLAFPAQGPELITSTTYVRYRGTRL